MNTYTASKKKMFQKLVTFSVFPNYFSNLASLDTTLFPEEV